MSALTLPNLNLAEPDTRPGVFTAAPWVTALVIFGVFALSDWVWNSSQRWYQIGTADMGEMVDRISDGQFMRQAAFAILFVYSTALLLLPSGRQVRMKLSILYPVIVFCVWAMVSVLWSTDKALTLKRLVVLLTAIITIAAVIKHFDWKQIGQMALIGGVLTLAVGSVNEARILLTDSPPLGLWRFGGTMHPNHAALHCGVAMLASLYLFKLTGRRWLMIVFAFAMLILFFTKSRTALMAIMTAVAVFWLLATTRSRLGWAVLGTAWTVSLILWLSSLGTLPAVNSYVSMGRTDVQTSDVTKLTGRTDIWKFALMQAAKDPNRTFTGYGYQSFWTPENVRAVSEYQHFKISEGHDVYLDWYLSLGLVGSGLFVVLLLTGLFRWTSAAWRLASASAAVGAAILAGTLVHGITESSSGAVSFPTFFIYVAIAGAAVRRPDELPEEFTEQLPAYGVA